MIYIIALYVIGCIACYFVCRESVYDRNEERQWVLFDKIIVCIMSILSWLTISILIITAILTVTKVINPDEKVKW